MRLGADRHVTADEAAALQADVAVECAGTPAAPPSARSATQA
jgi:hypothetical protein